MTNASLSPPPVEPEYTHVRRYWDRTRSTWVAKILPGEFYVTAQEELITTVLGSCVSACIRDPRFGIGGMNHFMLPHATEQHDHWDGISLDGATRFGSFAMERMINAILKRGGRRERLEVKVFGGGQIMANMTNIGLSNIEFVHRYLLTEGLHIHAEDVGGPHPRKVVYYPKVGRVQVKRLKSLHNDTILRREIDYMHTIETQPIHGEAELF